MTHYVLDLDEITSEHLKRTYPGGPCNVQSIKDILGEKCPHCGKTTRLFYDSGCRVENNQEQVFVNMFDGMIGIMECISCKKNSVVTFHLEVEALE